MVLAAWASGGCDMGPVDGSPDLGLRAEPRIERTRPLADAIRSGPFVLQDETDRGRLERVVQCALPAGAELRVRGPGGACLVFAGHLGLAPEWVAGECGQSCDDWVSTCLEPGDGVAAAELSVVQRVLEAAGPPPGRTWRTCNAPDSPSPDGATGCVENMATCFEDAQCCSGSCVGAYAALGWAGGCW